MFVCLMSFIRARRRGHFEFTTARLPTKYQPVDNDETMHAGAESTTVSAGHGSARSSGAVRRRPELVGMSSHGRRDHTQQTALFGRRPGEPRHLQRPCRNDVMAVPWQRRVSNGRLFGSSLPTAAVACQQTRTEAGSNFCQA